MSKMASGEPSKFVKKTIARKFEGKNLYNILHDPNESESDDNDQGGGAPLYTPTEERAGGAPLYSPKEEKGGGAPLYSPTEETGGGVPLYSPTETDGDSASTHHNSNGSDKVSSFLSVFQFDGAAGFIDAFKILASTPAQPVIAYGNAQGRPVTSVHNGYEFDQTLKQDTDIN